MERGYRGFAVTQRYGFGFARWQPLRGYGQWSGPHDRASSGCPVTRALRIVLSTLLFLAAVRVFGDAGVIIPVGQEQPNPAYLSLEEMRIDILIDNGDARVAIRQ